MAVEEDDIQNQAEAEALHGGPYARDCPAGIVPRRAEACGIE